MRLSCWSYIVHYMYIKSDFYAEKNQVKCVCSCSIIRAGSLNVVLKRVHLKKKERERKTNIPPFGSKTNDHLIKGLLKSATMSKININKQDLKGVNKDVTELNHSAIDEARENRLNKHSATRRDQSVFTGSDWRVLLYVLVNTDKYLHANLLHTRQFISPFYSQKSPSGHNLLHWAPSLWQQSGEEGFQAVLVRLNSGILFYSTALKWIKNMTLLVMMVHELQTIQVSIKQPEHWAQR